MTEPMPHDIPINPERLLATFLELLAIDSPSHHEGPVIQHLAGLLAALGVEAEIDAVGNLIGRLGGDAEPLLLCAHVDHVVPAIGIRPQVKGGIVRSDGTTGLGGDDTSGVAIILELIRAFGERGIRPPLEVLFTVGEEVGLIGSTALDVTKLRARNAVVLDMGGPIGPIIVQGPSQIKLEATMHGKKAHAGVSPELGINAIRVASEAIAAMPLGRIDPETTANIGIIQGGEATNIVPDRVTMHGEARSLDDAKLQRQTGAMEQALRETAARHGTTVDLEITHSYSAFRVPDDAPLVCRLSNAVRAWGGEPTLIPTGGGSDANTLNGRGITAVNLSTGMSAVHTTEEYIALSDMMQCARIVAQCLLDW